MFKLRVDWHQVCESCGTEVVVDYLGCCPAECCCPWCGTLVKIDVDADGDVKHRVSEAVSRLEGQVNSELQA
jgi:hypothetical protein